MSKVRIRWVTKDQVGCEADVGHVTFIMLAGVGGRAWKQVHLVGFFSGRHVGLPFVCVCVFWFSNR